MEKTKANEVIITIRGGTASVGSCPIGIIVRIWDYDIDGIDEDLLDKDDFGRKCCQSVFKSK